MVGEAEMSCQENGTWSAVRRPWCRPKISCRPFRAPVHGRFAKGLRKGRRGGSGLVRAGDSVGVTCEKGWCVNAEDRETYSLKKNYKRVCGQNGRWIGGVPRCVGET